MRGTWQKNYSLVIFALAYHYRSVIDCAPFAAHWAARYHKPTGKGMKTMIETAVKTKEYRMGATALAKRCGLSRTHVSRILRGERPCGDTPRGRRLAALLRSAGFAPAQ